MKRSLGLVAVALSLSFSGAARAEEPVTPPATVERVQPRPRPAPSVKPAPIVPRVEPRPRQVQLIIPPPMIPRVQPSARPYYPAKPIPYIPRVQPSRREILPIRPAPYVPPVMPRMRTLPTLPAIGSEAPIDPVIAAIAEAARILEQGAGDPDAEKKAQEEFAKGVEELGRAVAATLQGGTNSGRYEPTREPAKKPSALSTYKPPKVEKAKPAGYKRD